jgi:hypothetical protein
MTLVSKRSSIMATALIIAAIVTVVITQWASAGSPAPDEVISQAMAGLTERGVPVKSWSLEGSTLKVAMQSAGAEEVGTPDDPINLSLVQREAFLAKSRGLDLARLQIEVTNAKEQTLFVGDIVLDKELDSSWSKTEALGESDTLEAVRGAITGKTDLSGLTLGPLALTSDTGWREIRLSAVAADAKSASASTASLMINLYNAVNDANTLKNGQIALAFADITDKQGEPLLKWIYDAQRGTQDWWQAPGMTTDWFETPRPATTFTDAQ